MLKKRLIEFFSYFWTTFRNDEWEITSYLNEVVYFKFITISKFLKLHLFEIILNVIISTFFLYKSLIGQKNWIDNNVLQILETRHIRPYLFLFEILNRWRLFGFNTRSGGLFKNYSIEVNVVQGYSNVRIFISNAGFKHWFEKINTDTCLCDATLFLWVIAIWVDILILSANLG